MHTPPNSRSLSASSLFARKTIKRFYLFFSIISFFSLAETLYECSAHPMEIGIFLLPPEEIKEQSNILTAQVKTMLSAHGFSFQELINTPHISLFQMCVEKKKIKGLEEQLIELLKTFTFPVLTMKNSLTDTQENVFWDVDTHNDDKTLNALHKRIVDCASPFRSKKLMKQIQALSFLTDRQQENIHQYGIFWGLPGNLNPHITLVYNSGTDQIDEAGRNVTIQKVLDKISVTQNELFSQNKIFTVSQIAIGRLGFFGNVEEILTIFENQKEE